MDNQKQLDKAKELLASADDMRQAAGEADSQQPGTGNWPAVINEYSKSIQHLTFCIKYEKNPYVKSKLIERREHALTSAENIKQRLQENDEKTNPQNPDKSGGGGATLEKKASTQDKKDEEDKAMKNAMEGAIMSEKPNVKWSDIAGLEMTKGILKETVIFPIKFPQLFTGKRKPWKGILLYGPPGTGKTQIARAVATECDSTFFSLSSADLMSKWQGESEKMVRNLFQCAREQKPSVVFIDEIDSLAGSRGEGESESARRVKTEFLVQMDGCGNDMTGILMLSATNCPWDLDSAIRRRFEKRILIPLPDLEGRRAMVDIAIGDTPVKLSDEEKMLIAERCDGYSGADIGILAREALFQPITKCSKAKKFKKVFVSGATKWTPCSPNDPSGVEMNIMDIQSDELLPPIADVQDFLEALTKTKPSVGAEDIERQREWTNQFGQEGN